MSEYQLYEFLAIDRPLDATAMAELRQISSRAEITPTRLFNTYSYGDFRGNPRALMKKYFDAMIYLTNWGTRQLMLKLPRGAVDPAAIKPYCLDEVLEMEVRKDFVLLDFPHQEDEGQWIDDEESQALLSSLVPLRNELIRGEHAALYLAWLDGAARMYLAEADEESRVEPPVPRGLKAPTAACQALCELLGIDDDLLLAASETSEDALSPEDISADLRAWLKKVPVTDKDAWLERLATGAGAGIEGELLQRFGVERRRPPARGAAPARRTIAEIAARADELQRERHAREARAEAASRAARARAEAKALEKRLAALAPNESAAWSAIEAHVLSKDTSRYDEAVATILDLRVLADRNGTLATFEERIRALRERHASKQAFVRRLRQKLDAAR